MTILKSGSAVNCDGSKQVYYPPALYCTLLYSTVLYCTLLYCTLLYSTVLYSTTLRTNITLNNNLKKYNSIK